MAPFHPAGENPTLALQRDLELVEHLDRLGYDEAWIGEHHSAGSEIIASPEIFIATAAERTRTIRLGTGVVSLAYHNPLWVTERMVLLDHLTRGRAMLGVGPGSLPTDSAMIGLSPTDTRELLDTNLDVVMRLLRGDEPMSVETPTHKLIDAHCTCGRTPTRTWTSRSPRSRRRPGRAWRAATASACCRSARR
jgi:limonene 1,2-monooxygenase